MWVVPPMVTCFSCIASRSAAWTLAGARFISSARMMLAKIGPFFTEEFSVGLIVDLRSHDIRRQKVRCKLDSTEGGIDRFSQSPHGERLREPRNSLEKYVTASQQTYEESFDHVVLPHDAAAHLSHDRPGLSMHQRL